MAISGFAVVELAECFVEHPRTNIPKLMQAHKRRYQPGKRVLPALSVLAGKAVQVTLIFVGAMAVMCVHRGLLLLFR